MTCHKMDNQKVSLFCDFVYAVSKMLMLQIVLHTVNNSTVLQDCHHILSCNYYWNVFIRPLLQYCDHATNNFISQIFVYQFFLRGGVCHSGLVKEIWLFFDFSFMTL